MTQSTLIKNISYIDVTTNWLKEKTENGKVLNSYYYITNNKIYIVDGSKKVQLNYSEKEYKVAKWLVNTFGGTLYMKPRVNQPEGIKTADYFWKGEYWDLKKITSPGKNVFDNRLNNYKKQSKNFIFDISNNPLSIKEIKRQINNIYNSDNRVWIKKIIVKKHNKVLAVYERKKIDHPAQYGRGPIS